jgi:hypothetical protein
VGLYANEEIQVNLYDPETGEYLDGTGLTPEEEEIRSFIANGKVMERLKRHAGWKLLTDFMKANVSKYKEGLVNETDFEKVKRMQEAVKAYENVMTYVDAIINESKGLEQQTDPSNQG